MPQSKSIDEWRVRALRAELFIEDLYHDLAEISYPPECANLAAEIRRVIKEQGYGGEDG